MQTYSLDKILEPFTDFNSSEDVDFNKYKRFLNEYVELCKPDFVALISINSDETILYENNFNLDFDILQRETLKDIITSVDPDQIDKILTADKYCRDFVNSNSLKEASILFQLRFTVALQEGNPRTFLRKIIFVRNYDSIINEPILLVSIFDVTEWVGIKKNAHVEFKYISKAKIKKKDKLIGKLAAFQKKANSMLRDQIKLTKREKEILKLISKGKTSGEISKELSIAVATVNTHRQNLIKKYNVKNTSALIHMV